MTAELYFPLTNLMNRGMSAKYNTGVLSVQVEGHKFYCNIENLVLWARILYCMNFEKGPNGDGMRKNNGSQV